MIRVPLTIKALLKGNPLYRFGGHHGPIIRDQIMPRQEKSGTA